MPEPPLARRFVRGVAVLAACGIALLCALVASLWLEHRSGTALPAPSGPFAAGRTIQAWADDVGTDATAPVPGTKRELLVWIWYPSAPGPSVPAADYIPARMLAAAGPAGGLPGLLTRDLSKVHGHSARDADVAPQGPAYPVVILRAGASAPVVSYTTLAEDLASHGYIVVGFDAPYRTYSVVFPDGRVIERTTENDLEAGSAEDHARRAGNILTAWTADMAFVLDRLERLNAADASGRFAGRLDMRRVGVFGHSFGGAAAAQFCSEDRRCRAGIDVDGALHGSVIQAGLHQPFMFLLSDHGDTSDPESRQIQADIRSVYDRLPAEARLRVVIRGANHFLFSDDGALLKSQFVQRMLRTVGVLGIDGRRQLAVTAYCVHRFFDAYLKETGPSKLDVSSPQYPEIQVVE